MINYVNDYTTSDGYVFRVSATAFSQRRINSSKQHEIRLTMNRILSERIPQLSLNDFVKDATMGKLGSDLMETTKKISVIRHVGIRKTKLISSPLQNETNDLVSDQKVHDDLDNTLMDEQDNKLDANEIDDKIEGAYEEDTSAEEIIETTSSSSDRS
jgi:small subunit ribosomal protein S3Ae